MKNEWHDWNLCFVLHLRLVWCMLSRSRWHSSHLRVLSADHQWWVSTCEQRHYYCHLWQQHAQNICRPDSQILRPLFTLCRGKVPAYDAFCRGVRIWAMFRKDSSRSYLKLAVEYRCIYSLKARSSACWCVPLSFICTLTHLCSLGGRWWALLGFKCPWGNLTPICFKELLIILFVINMKLGE